MVSARGGPQVIPRPQTVAPGAPAPWSGREAAISGLVVEDVVDRFATRAIETSVSALPVAKFRSAVAVVVSGPSSGDRGVVSGRAGCELLLTRRAWHLRTHSGEVAFPGGVEDADDDFPVGTAIREASEEVGLDPSVVTPIGALDPLATFASGGAIVPIVMIARHRPAVVASPDEVEAVLHVSLSDLVHPDCYHQERWSWEGHPELRRTTDHPMHFFELPGDTIWGATAAMIYQFLVVLLDDQ